MTFLMGLLDSFQSIHGQSFAYGSHAPVNKFFALVIFLRNLFNLYPMNLPPTP